MLLRGPALRGTRMALPLRRDRERLFDSLPYFRCGRGAGTPSSDQGRIDPTAAGPYLDIPLPDFTRGSEASSSPVVAAARGRRVHRARPDPGHRAGAPRRARAPMIRAPASSALSAGDRATGAKEAPVTSESSIERIRAAKSL